jgi:hypothetical protein
MLAIGLKVRGFIPSQGRWIFKGNKNPQHDFLWRGSKAVGPMSQICMACYKDTCGVWQRYFVGKINGNFSPGFSLLCY